MIEEDSIIFKKLKQAVGPAIIETILYRGEVTFVIDSKDLLDVCRALKGDDDLRMNYLSDIAGVDHHPETPRFAVVYHLYSISRKIRLRLKLRVADGESVPSLTPLWNSASCAEREAYDMFGIVFEGHPSLRRIYLPDDWEGFPLRKDYPLKGYKDEYNPYGEEKE